MRLGLTHRLPKSSSPLLGARPTLLALALILTTPAQAGWIDHVFGAPQAATVPQNSAAALATPSNNALAITTPKPTLSPGEQINDDYVPGNTDEDDDADSADSEDDGAYLPNVDESDSDDNDDNDLGLNIDELTQMGDLWAHLRQGFQLDLGVDNDRIATQRNWYLQHPAYLDRVARRAARYLHYTVAEAEKRGIPNELALLPVIESAYDPFAYSHADAAGMWQFIPGTAKLMGLKLNTWFDGRRDILESTRAGYDFLTQLHDKFGDWQLALAAYNAGPGAVQRAINRNAAAGLPTDFWSLPLPAETRAYVPRFLAIAQIINNPESFSVSLRPIVNKPFFRVVETHGQVDMPEAAHLAGVSLKEFYQLNAGFKRQTTDPEGPHRLLVPAYLPVDFEAQITALPIPAHHNTVRYKVKRGDTLFALTKRFDVSAEQIRQLNRLKKDQLPVGHTITLSQANTSPEFLALSQELRLDRIASPRRVTQSTHYKVRRGDTLASIAKRHHVSVANLKRWNHIKGQSVHAGQQLVIQSKASPSKQRVAKNSASKNNSHKVSYKVRPGDTLNSIGRRYNISVKQIRGWNSGSGNLQAGQRLTLFVNRATAQNL